MTTSISRSRRHPLATSDIEIAEHSLRHHFASMDQQRETSTFGMWLFLVTEIMFFGGLFCAYLVYRATYYQAFVEGSQTMNIWLGATNTAVLICSSLSMALAVRCAQTDKRQMMIVLLLITILFGLVSWASRASSTTSTGPTISSRDRIFSSRVRTPPELIRRTCRSTSRFIGQ